MTNDTRVIGWLRVLVLIALAGCHVEAAADGPLLLRDPSLSRTHVVFSYAGDVWVAHRDGRDLRRLTRTGRAGKPSFSPDGSRIAFIGQRDGVRSVYVVSLTGGEPRRLTFHPLDLGEQRMNRTGDLVGWTPDGQRVVFSSRRAAYASGVVQLFTVPAAGGAVEPIPLIRAAQASFSADGRRVAYVANTQWQSEWKGYRGGQTTSIRIADLDDSSIVATIPRENSNDSNPMWVGDHVYFLSDRRGPVTLYSYDVKSGEVRQLVSNDGFDLKSAAAVSDAIVYEQFGSLHLLDLKTGRERPIDLRPAADFAEVRPHVRSAAEVAESMDRPFAATPSPSGSQVVFGLRGEILVAGTRKGDGRNLTLTPGAVERDPAWSPDGRSIAYFSDESGEYALHVRDVSGRTPVRRIDLGEPPSFYYTPVWSPDSRKIGYTDKRLNYWFVDLENGTRVRVDTDLYVNPAESRAFAWSPDSRWFAYTKQLPSHLHAVFVHSLEHGRSFQLTDGMSDALHVAFDGAGDRLYFTASADSSMKTGLLQIPSMLRPVRRSVHALLLHEVLPLLTDRHAVGDRSRVAGAAGTANDDPRRLARWIVTLPIPVRHYDGLSTGRPGSLYLVERTGITEPLVFVAGLPARNVYRFDLDSRRTEQVLDDVVDFEVSASGGTMAYARRTAGNRAQWFVAPITVAPSKSREPRGARPLVLDSVRVPIEPRTEWAHMFEQVWRNQRDFFYDPGLHGLDHRATRLRYEPFLRNLASRDDLDYLFGEMLGNLSVDHVGVTGPQGSAPKQRQSKTGLLGADYTVRDNRFCFARIYERDTWNPDSRAPLREPGIDVEAGDCLLAADGREVLASTDVHAYFEGQAGKRVVIRVGSSADGTDARDVTVVPVEDEASLRQFAWVEDNRRTVDELTNGRVAYVYLPDVSSRGYRSFNRYYFAQVGRDALIVDERFNAGGVLADYVLDYLRRPLMNYFHMRDGRDISTPLEGIFGPKVMIINELAGSGGDHLPWLFRRAGLGPLVGKRTWGGLVGGATNPDDLIDGGQVNTPNLAFYDAKGDWDAANHSVRPDVEVEEDPAAARLGRDLQLERSVEVALDLLRRNPSPSVPQHPPYRTR